MDVRNKKIPILKNKKCVEDRFYKNIKQFCLSTNLHGYKFIFKSKTMLVERASWVVVCMAALITVLVLIAVAIQNFKDNPLILITDSTHYSIWNYDFPAVTICENNKISKARAFRVAAKLLQTNDTDKINDLANEFKYMYFYIKNRLPNDRNLISHFMYLQNFFDTHNVSSHQVIKWLANDCDDMIVKCLWKRSAIKCNDLFRPILTPAGICCTFNYFVIKNQTNFNSKLAKPNLSKQPHRVSSCGYHSGLILLVNNDKDDYFATYIPSIGHKVKVHNPYAFPDWNTNNILSPKSVVNFISISPVITHSNDDVRNVPLEYRQCIFADERKLLYFKQYNFHNCLVECRMNITRDLCNCTPYYYIDETITDPTVRVCNLLDIPCLSKIENLVTTSLPNENHTDNEPLYTGLRKRCNFNCYRDCDFTFYYTNSMTTTLNQDNVVYVPYLFEGIPIKDHSVLRIYFNSIDGTKNRRHVRMSWDTILGTIDRLPNIL